MNENLIGFFDSGIGGLTLLKECEKKLPQENFIYFGDNENSPYGIKSEEEIFACAKKAMDFFYHIGVKAVVLACNTVTTVCAERFRREYVFPIVGVEPALKPAVQFTNDVLVLATQATIKSKNFCRLRARFIDKKIEAYTPQGLVEEIERTDDFNKIDLNHFLPKINPKAVVLGCTHYIFLREQIENYYHCPVFDGNSGTSDHLKDILENNKLLANKTSVKSKILFVGNDNLKNKSKYEQMFVNLFN